MSPDFDEIADGEGPALPEGTTIEALRRVHELLVSAPPPPELGARLAEPPRLPRPRAEQARARLGLRSRRRLGGALALAATLGTVAAFAIGYGVGHSGSPGLGRGFTRAMHGVGPLTSAHALLWVGRRDASGNWPLEMNVHGLPPLPDGGWYELYLTERGKPDILCGTLRTGSSAPTHVSLTAPSAVAEYSGWIVTTHVGPDAGRVLMRT